jgi:hypothetical protein
MTLPCQRLLPTNITLTLYIVPITAQQVLTNYLDLSNVLTGRLVCEGWRKTFGTAVKQLQLQQPGSARATLALGLKAAAAKHPLCA